ncbi:MAG: hypothetical protein WA771_08495, partial [Chthoniobacterales bacterium]
MSGLDAQTESHFLGGPGNYSDPLNWDTVAYPNDGQPTAGDTYNAIIDGGDVTLDVNVTVNSLDFSTASMVASGTKTITATMMTLGNGAVFGGGVVRLNGSAGLSGGSAATFINVEGGAELANLGSFTHTQAGSTDTGIILNSDGAGGGSVLRNASGATFTAATTTSGGSVGFGAADARNQFINAGTFVKSGADTYDVNVSFVNSGAVQVQGGTLRLNGGGGTSTTGSHAVTGTLALSGGFNFASGASVTGSGTLTNNSGTTTFASGSNLSAGRLELVSGNVVVASGATLGTANLAVNGGTLTSNVDHTFTDTTFANGGAVLGSGDVTFLTAVTFDQSTYTFGGTGTKTFATNASFTTTSADQFLNINGGTEVVNSAQFTQARLGSGASAIVLNADSADGGSVFRNTGTFIANASGGAASIGTAGADAGNQFQNAGTFRKRGFNSYSADVAFVNSGTLEVQQGTMNLTAGDGGSTTGTATISTNATLGLAGGHSFASGAAVNGAGTLRVNSGAVTFGSGAALSTGKLELVSGTTTLAAGSTVSGTTSLAVLGGTLVSNIDHTFTGAAFANAGVVAGSGAVTFAGATSFDGSSPTFGGAGAKIFSGIATVVSGASDQFFNVNGGTTVTNSGNFTQRKGGAGDSQIILNSDAAGGNSSFANTGTFTADIGSRSAGIGFGSATGTKTFENLGQFNKTGGGIYNANVVFRNAGAVSVQGGTLNLNAGSGATAVSGDFAVGSGATLGLNGTNSFSSTVAVSGAGTLVVRGGTTNFASGSSFAAGALDLVGGTTTFATGSTIGSTSLKVSGGTLDSNVDHTFSNTTFSNGGVVTGSGATTFGGTSTFDGSTYTFGGSGTKTFTGTTVIAAGSADQFINIAGGTEVVNTSSFTQRRAGDGLSSLVLNSDSGGAATFRNAAGAFFTADVTTGIASVGFGAAVAGNEFVNQGFLNKTGAGGYQVNVPIANSGTVIVGAGTLAATAGITGTGTIDVNPSAVLDLSENVHTSRAGQLKHNGANLALGSNDIVVSGDYTNANFGSGNSFDGRANVTGSGKVQASGDATLLASGDASTGTIDFGTIHIGETANKSYAMANTGTTGPSVRGALQTSVNGGNVTDGRLSGDGVTAGNI